MEEIRILQKKDYEEYISLIEDFRSIGTYINKQKFHEIYDTIFKNSIIFVLVLNNKIIASAKLIIDQKFFHKLAKYGHIEDVIVRSNQRGNGYGKQIINHIIDYCKKHNFYKITLSCKENLIPFYKKNNFEVYQIHMSQLL